MLDDAIKEIINAQGWQEGDKLVFTFRPSRRRRLWNFITRRKEKPRMLRVWAYDEPVQDVAAIKVNYGSMEDDKE